MNDDFTLNVDKSLVSLNKSILDTGDGDDLILLRGNIQSSVIEPGSGKDQVIVQGAIDNFSQINIDEEDVFVRLPLLSRIEFLPESSKDWDATKNSEVSLIMGNNDINTRSKSMAKIVASFIILILHLSRMLTLMPVMTN